MIYFTLVKGERTMATKRQRYMISVDDDMFNAIEDFRFKRRYQTRSEATSELIRLGLQAVMHELENDISSQKKRSNSAD